MELKYEIVDEFVYTLNEYIKREETLLHEFYKFEGSPEIGTSIVLNKKNNQKNNFDNLIEYLTQSYEFQNSNFTLFAPYDKVYFNKKLPLVAFGEDLNGPFIYCEHIKTKEICILFEEKNEILDYCSPSAEIFFQLLTDIIPFLSFYDALMREKNNVPEPDLSSLVDNLMIKYKLELKYKTFLTNTLIGVG